MTTLFHYSPLLHLPPILAEGLSRGEIAHPDLTRRDQAVSLTTQSDPDRLYCWGGDAEDHKKAVRYACEIRSDDPLLQPARDLWREMKVQRESIKLLDPYGQSKWWYFYRGVIPRASFRVQLRGRSGYVDFPDPKLDRIAGEVAAVREKFEFERPDDRPWELLLRLKNPDDEAPLRFFYETHPAERYLPPPAT
jgi:hypothetical protein